MNEEDIKLIGKRIKKLRLELGLTQEELASKIAFVKGKSSIANYENGSNLPSDEVKFKMCEIFSCSLDYLMCKTNIKNYDNINKELLDIGLSKKDYNPPTREQQEKIEEFARFVLKDNLKKKEDK